MGAGLRLDEGNPGRYTHPVVEGFEPHVIWERPFLELRKACYTAVNDARAEQAKSDLDEFMQYESATSTISKLTKALEARSSQKKK